MKGCQFMPPEIHVPASPTSMAIIMRLTVMFFPPGSHGSLSHSGHGCVGVDVGAGALGGVGAGVVLLPPGFRGNRHHHGRTREDLPSAGAGDAVAAGADAGGGGSTDISSPLSHLTRRW